MTSTENRNSPDLQTCILAQLSQVEECEYQFSKLQNHFNIDQNDPDSFQFEIEAKPCFSKVIFVKSSLEDQIGSFILDFREANALTLAELEAGLAKFHPLPALPTGGWSAMLMLEKNQFRYGYTLILNSNTPLKSETLINQLTVRIDY